jgi:TusA-related sulfurtransferase
LRVIDILVTSEPLSFKQIPRVAQADCIVKVAENNRVDELLIANGADLTSAEGATSEKPRCHLWPIRGTLDLFGYRCPRELSQTVGRTSIV